MVIYYKLRAGAAGAAGARKKKELDNIIFLYQC